MRGKRKLIRGIIILAVAGVAYWQKGNFDFGKNQSAPSSSQQKEKQQPKFKIKLPGSKQSTSSTKKQGAYDVLEGCRLIDHRNNDGDSFFIQYGNGKVELRIYFVDCPEKYLSDRYQKQRDRVAEQGREMGGMTPQQTVAIGQKAKAHVKNLLGGKTFTVFTYWEEVYGGDRRYGFVQLPGSKKYICEELVEQGLGRIYTKGPGSKQHPVPTPDGKSFFQFRDHLRKLERSARAARRGAWGV